MKYYFLIVAFLVNLLLFSYNVTAQDLSKITLSQSNCSCNESYDLEKTLNDPEKFILDFRKSLYETIKEKNTKKILNFFTSDAQLVTIIGNIPIKDEFSQEIFDDFTLLKYDIKLLGYNELSKDVYWTVFSVFKTFQKESGVFSGYAIHGSILLRDSDNCWRIKTEQILAIPPREIPKESKAPIIKN